MVRFLLDGVVTTVILNLAVILLSFMVRFLLDGVVTAVCVGSVRWRWLTVSYTTAKLTAKVLLTEEYCQSDEFVI